MVYDSRRHSLRTAYLVGGTIGPILDSCGLEGSDRLYAGRVLADLTENIVRADPERHVDEVGRLLREHWEASQ